MGYDVMFENGIDGYDIMIEKDFSSYDVMMLMNVFLKE